MSRQKSFNSFPGKTFIQSLHVYLYCVSYEAMSDTTDPELCSLITNVCKPPKSFDFLETEQPFRFVWQEEFPWVCYSWWEDRTYCLPCVLFGHKNVEKSLRKIMSTIAYDSKKIQKNQMLQRNTQKEKNIISYIFRWIHIVS